MTRSTSWFSANPKDPLRPKLDGYGPTPTSDPHPFNPRSDSAFAAFRRKTAPKGPPPSQPTTNWRVPGQAAAAAGPPCYIPASPPADYSQD